MALAILSIMATGLVGFLTSVVFDVYDLKAEVRAEKRVVELIYEDVKAIKSHILKEK